MRYALGTRGIAAEQPLPLQPVRLVGALGIELLGTLKARKLLIRRNGKREKNNKNGRAMYAWRTQKESLLRIAAPTKTAQAIRNPNSAQHGKTNPNYV